MNKNKKPLVSVIIPSYNNACYLPRAFQSVLNQTYKNLELIIIDNNSTDNSDEVIRSFNDERIIYLKIHNKGVIAKSRNAGIRVAKGEWVAFLDSDDWWTHNKLEICFGHINEKVDLIYHDLQIVSETFHLFRRVAKSRDLKKPVIIDLLINGNAIATSSVMVRSGLLKKIGGMNEDPTMVAAEDYNTWLRIAKITHKFSYIKKRLGFYRQHNINTSSQKDMSIQTKNAIAEFVKILKPEQIRRVEGRLSYTKGRLNYQFSNYLIARNELMYCILNGALKLKIKAIYMCIMIFLKSNILLHKNKS